TDRGGAGAVAKAAHARKAHRRDKPREIVHRALPIVFVVGRASAVAVPALIVAVDAADRAERRGDGPVDSSQETGGVQDHDRRAEAAPVDIVQPDAVDFYVAVFGLAGLYGCWHDWQMIEGRADRGNRSRGGAGAIAL